MTKTISFAESLPAPELVILKYEPTVKPEALVKSIIVSTASIVSLTTVVVAESAYDHLVTVAALA